MLLNGESVLARDCAGLVGAPCFSRGSWTLVQRKTQREKIVALATAFEGPALKRETKLQSSLRSAEALLPRVHAGAPT